MTPTEAQQYAAEARARNVKPVACPCCATREKEAEVVRVVRGYRSVDLVKDLFKVRYRYV